MATHVFFEFSSSPSKPTTLPAVQRTIHPSPDKRTNSTVLVLPLEKSERAENGSPRSKRQQITMKQEFSLGRDPKPSALLMASNIDLSFPMIVDGHAIGPTGKNDWKELTSLFSTTYEAWMTTPFVIICVRTLPPRPWPFTIGGYPLHITTDKHEHPEPIDRGWMRHGRWNTMLENYDLMRREKITLEILSEVLASFKSLNVTVHEIMSFEGFFRIVVSDDTDLEVLPTSIAHQGVYYKFLSEEPVPDLSVLRQKPPSGVIQDNHNYLADGNILLRPGIMVSSSLLSNGEWKSTTSGILVVDKLGTPFITVATHGFNPDGEVWHPDPTGVMIGKIVFTIPGADISMVRLTKDIRYVNQTFGTPSEPEGIKTNGISPGYPPHLKRYNGITMNNPFSGYAEGQVLGLGIKIEGCGDVVQHEWLYMDCGTEPIDSSCGSLILAADRTVVGFFRFKHKNSKHCYAVNAIELREAEYEICEQEMEF